MAPTGPGNIDQDTFEAAIGSAPHAYLRELASALKELHHTLLEEQRHSYERLEGPIRGGAHLLHLVTHDPFFAWLRSLSAVMVDLDTLLDEAMPPTPDEAAAIRRELDELFSAGGPPPFWERCAPLLQAPPVAIAYARVRTTLAVLPVPAVPSSGDWAADLHAKHRWSVARRKRGAP
jgi:hypothetical protein